MGKSREDLVKWAINKTEQYLKSARDNLVKERLYPAAEKIGTAAYLNLKIS